MIERGLDVDYNYVVLPVLVVMFSTKSAGVTVDGFLNIKGIIFFLNALSK